jgi:undecaprenyl phosphate-alpha-L-ara4N flippase subunit ArnF
LRHGPLIVNGRGLAYAMTSVALVSAAQLVMRWSMTRLPRIEALPIASQGVQWLPMGLLILGIAWYAASLLCWLRALESLPLGRAYSLLSLSYPLVYLFAALLPGLGGSLTVGKTLGVILVVAGVVLINARQA